MNLGSWMKKTGEKAADVSRGSGVPENSLSRFLNGENPLSAKNIGRLVTYTKGKITFNDLVKEAQDRMAKRGQAEASA